MRRRVEEKIFKFLMIISLIFVFGSLLLILATIFLKGLSSLSLNILLKTPKGGYYLGREGGILNAILGSLVLGISSTFLSFLLSLPIAFYLNNFLKRGSNFALFVRFSLDVLWGIPSIVYGAFGFTIMVLIGLKTSLLAGIITVSFLILPIMARSMDEVLKMIPSELKEASYALGANKIETSIKVVMRQAFPGILTAVIVSFGRGIGDAASVLFTAGFTDNLPTSLFKPVATLPLAIFFQISTPFPEVQKRGYASAFILTLIVFLISIISRILSKRFSRYRVR
jgi:phosphate transport system permease protein